MKAILCWLFVLLVVGCYSSYVTYEKAYKRYVIVLADSILSSGVRVGGGIILAASHAVHPDSFAQATTIDRTIYAEPRIEGEIAILRGDRLNLDTILVSDVFLGNEVHWIQPRFEPGGGVFLTFGRVAIVSDSSFCIDRPIMFGASGSGVWNQEGELVGILQSFIEIHGLPMYARATRLWKYRRMP